MLMKSKGLIIDRQLKRKLSADEKLLMINRKKPKTEHSFGKKVNSQDVISVEGGGETLYSGSLKKQIPSKRPLTNNNKSKRNLSFILKKAIRARKKRKMEKVDNGNELIEPVDRISELPEPIIHHILSLLRCPRDVTRTTALSKKWGLIWASFYSFDFDQKKFKTSGGDHTEKFITFVNNSLATKLPLMHSVHKFKLSLFQVSKNLKLETDNWINAAINKDVKELEIHVEAKKRKHYMLPNIVLTAKTLTSLKLYGCKLDSTGVIDLCNLKELSLKNAYVNADMIKSFVQGCPLVEDLRLVYCKGIGHLHISDHCKLKTIVLHECHGLVEVKVDLPSLIRFVHCGKESWICKMQLEGCENLKYLTFKDSNLSDELFQNLITKFLDLEKLVLRSCYNLERITILSIKLKELSVIRCKKLEEVNIDAPNLSVLEYSGEKMPFSCMNVAGLHEAKLNIQIKKNKFAVFRELLSFLRKFENNGDWKLIVNSNKNITIYEEIRKIQHLSSTDLKLELVKSPMKLKAYVDNLLRMSRPKSLSLMSSSRSEFLKFVKEKTISREENPKCCTYYLKKCWLHYIKDVTMVVFEKSQIGDTSQDLQQTTFRFNWK